MSRNRLYVGRRSREFPQILVSPFSQHNQQPAIKIHPTFLTSHKRTPRFTFLTSAKPILNMTTIANVNNKAGEEPEKKKPKHSPEKKAPTPNQEEERKWLLERTGLPSINDFIGLTKLNLPNCGLSALPVNLPELLPNLSILFAPKNHFEELPPIIGKCSKLQVSFVCPQIIALLSLLLELILIFC